MWVFFNGDVEVSPLLLELRGIVRVVERFTGSGIVADKRQTTILNISTTYIYAIHVSLLSR